MGPPEYLLTIELKRSSEPTVDFYWQCNVCLSIKTHKSQLVDIFEGCLTCGTKAARITPGGLRKLQAEWEMRKFLES